MNTSHLIEQYQWKVTYQTDIRIEAFLNVFPVEFDSASSDPQEDDSGQQQLRESPAHTGHEDLLGDEWKTFICAFNFYPLEFISTTPGHF